jgi:hypothetical protein
VSSYLHYEVLYSYSFLGLYQYYNFMELSSREKIAEKFLINKNLSFEIINFSQPKGFDS